jgi:hypothetical protein
MIGKIKYQFTAKPWQYAVPGGWYFISLPIGIADEIRNALKPEEEGWGRLKAKARTGNSEWETAMWYDTKAATYLLPLKAEIRRKENITTAEAINIIIWV